jgi:hypothetical protein
MHIALFAMYGSARRSGKLLLMHNEDFFYMLLSVGGNEGLLVSVVMMHCHLDTVGDINYSFKG